MVLDEKVSLSISIFFLGWFSGLQLLNKVNRLSSQPAIQTRPILIIILKDSMMVAEIDI